MKSRISFFNRAAFKKDVTRFAPAWALYSVGLAVMYLALMLEDSAYYRANNLADLLYFMLVVNCGYGFLNAQLLFGDLFNSRLCNALHAMPLRRETWYGTHLTAGVLFALVPNLVFSLLSALTMALGIGWVVPLYWLLGSMLQYLCFFGIAVFCVMLTGNRFASVLVYAIVNFFAMLVLWLVDSLYEPLLSGMRINSESFLWFCPFGQMMEADGLIDVLSDVVTDPSGYNHRWTTRVLLTDSLLWYILYAAVGVAMMGLGLAMYRKRKLECAGDFTAFQFAQPVFLAVYTVTVGVFLHLVADIFVGSVMRYVLLAVGLVVGFFTGLMLLSRTTRVFRPKAFANFGIFLAVFALSLVLTWVDPLGLTRWVPDAEDVESVNLSTRYEYNGYSEGEITLTEEADIANMIAVHEASTAQLRRPFSEPGYYGNVHYCIQYRMKDGSVRTRFYEANADSEAGKKLQPYFSSFEYLTGFTEDRIPEVAQRVRHIYAEELRDNTDDYVNWIADRDMEGLLRAIAADCAAGNMAQNDAYHMKTAANGDILYSSGTYLELGFNLNPGTEIIEYIYVRVYEESTNTLNWMIENGLYTPEEAVK